MFSLICARTNGCANNRDADNSRRHPAHYDVTVMPGSLNVQCQTTTLLGLSSMFDKQRNSKKSTGPLWRESNGDPGGKIPFTKSSWRHDVDVTWWRHQMETFSALLALCARNSPVTGEFPAQRPVTRDLMFSLICTWTNDWVNNRDAGDLRRHRGHYDVTIMTYIKQQLHKAVIRGKLHIGPF